MEEIRKRICNEDALSRINGLFPYVSFDDGVAVIRKASESVDGCYGKIVPNITLPTDAGLLIGADNEILTGGKIYSYRTLMDCYYGHASNLPSDNGFVKFMNKCIGKVFVDKDAIFQGHEVALDEMDMIPEFVYLSEVEDIACDMERTKALCESYMSCVSVGIHTDVESCCACDRFFRMGGDTMLSYYRGLVAERDSIADYAYGLVPSGYSAFPILSLQIPIGSDCKDLGILSPYVNEWVGGVSYVSHIDEYGISKPRPDIVTYDGDTYACTNSNSGDFNEESLSIDFPYDNGNKFKLMSEWGKSNIGQSEYDPLYSPEGFYTSRNTYGERYKYFTDISGNVVPDDYVAEHIRVNGTYHKWDDENVSYVQDDDAPDYYEVKGVTDSKLKSLRWSREFFNDHGVMERPSDGEDWLFYYKKGYTNAYSMMYDGAGNIISESDRESWTTDHVSGEIVHPDPVTGNLVPVGYDTNMIAYGNVIRNISYDADESKIVFEYVLGAHLKAKPMEIIVDDEGNRIYNYGDFEYDSDDMRGILHSETYRYSPSGDIAELVANGDFVNFTDKDKWTETYYRHNGSLIMVGVLLLSEFDTSVRFGDYDYVRVVNDIDMSVSTYHMWNGSNYDQIYDVTVTDYSCKRMTFSLSGNNAVCSVDVQDATFTANYVVSEYSVMQPNVPDFMYSGVFRTDYLCGVSFVPSVYSDLNLSRGNAAAFERHVKLGEIRTFEDLDGYSNGGFYNLIEN